MSDPLEAAATRWVSEDDYREAASYAPDYFTEKWGLLDEDRFKTLDELRVGAMRAAIGCPQCDGTGTVVRKCDDERCGGKHGQDFFDCPAEHVEIVVHGETIFADPGKCIWWCNRAEVGYVPLDRDEDDTGCRIDDLPHADCGWQPKWSAIKGGET